MSNIRKVAEQYERLAQSSNPPLLVKIFSEGRLKPYEYVRVVNDITTYHGEESDKEYHLGVLLKNQCITQEEYYKIIEERLVFLI